VDELQLRVVPVVRKEKSLDEVPVVDAVHGGIDRQIAGRERARVDEDAIDADDWVAEREDSSATSVEGQRLEAGLEETPGDALDVAARLSDEPLETRVGGVGGRDSLA
jgi:hypothetical protein